MKYLLTSWRALSKRLRSLLLIPNQTVPLIRVSESAQNGAIIDMLESRGKSRGKKSENELLNEIIPLLFICTNKTQCDLNGNINNY